MSVRRRSSQAASTSRRISFAPFVGAALAVCLLFVGHGARASDLEYDSLRRVLATYDEAHYDAAVSQLRAIADFRVLSRDFRDQAPKWMATGSADGQERRRRVVAIVSLEIAHIGLTDRFVTRAQVTEARAIVEFGCELI